MERQIEARAVDDGMGSMVRCLTFAYTYVTNGNDLTKISSVSYRNCLIIVTTPIASLWSGTNSSCVSVFVIYLPSNIANESIRKPITGQLAKEIQLKHRAPVIGITHYDNVRYEAHNKQNKI